MYIEIYDFCYRPYFGDYGNIWRPGGYVFNHPRFPPNHFVLPSLPVSFNEEDLTFDTRSGSHYHIMSFEGDKEECLVHLRENLTQHNFETVNLGSWPQGIKRT